MRRIVLAPLAAAAVVLAGCGGSSEKPITTSTLQQAASQAKAYGGGYDYVCGIYQAPRQLLCTGQSMDGGSDVLFLVERDGRLQAEPGLGQ